MDLSEARRRLARLDRGGWGVGPLYAGVRPEEAAELITTAAAPGAEEARTPCDVASLTEALSDRFGAPARIQALSPLSGGAVHAHWALDAQVAGEAGPRRLVLRAPQGAPLVISHAPSVEHQVIEAAVAAGVPAPRSLGPLRGEEAGDRPFLVLERLEGRTDPAVLLALDEAAGDRLAETLGRALARLHAVGPTTHPIPALGAPPEDPAAARLGELRRDLDAMGAVQPALDWGLAWLAQRLDDLPRGPVRLAHRDFRTANFLIDGQGRLKAVLDWEFAAWSDPAEDLGWLTAVCWRFHRRNRACGGFGSLSALLEGYHAAGGAPVTEAQLGFWRVYALIRWAVIALMQGARFDPDDPDTLDCGLTPWRLPELAVEILRRTRPGASLEAALEVDP